MELTFAAWLKRRRRALDLTQNDLAQRAFCSINTIRKIEAGELAPSKALALEIARALAAPEQGHEAFVRFARDPSATAPENGFTETRGDLPTEPFSTAVSIRFHPPASLATAIGRERDTKVVAGILRLPGARLVTLTGPPGTGKTRLGLEVAAELVPDEGRSEFEHGAAFVALAPLSQPTQVATAIAQTLNLREPTEHALCTFLRDKHLLLVLDNFEHLLAAAPLVTKLLMAAPRLKILTTSRESLRVYGEREFSVAPLATPPLDPLPPWQELENYAAVQLFVERAQAVQPGFELDNSNADAIARLVAGLDGLPLAIEMAAARVKWATPQELLAQLTRRLDLLRGRERGLDARQRTLRGAMDWSYGLLDATERRVFRQLGIFRGGLTAQAADAVCDAPVAAILQMLVEKSLVTREAEEDDAPRYDLLEILREYALEQLERAGELAAARARHAAFYRVQVHATAYAREYGTPGEWQRFDQRDEENYRLALDEIALEDRDGAIEFAADLYDFWTHRGLARQGLERLSQSLPNRASGAPLPDQASSTYLRGMLTLSQLAIEQGDIEAAESYAEAVRAHTALQPPSEPFGKSLQQLGYIALLRGEFARAAEWMLAARAVFQALGLRPHEARALNGLGLIAKDRGELERAQEFHHAALALRRECGVRLDIAQSLFNLAIVAYWRGEYARAIQLGSEAYEIYVSDAGVVAAGYLLETIGMAYFKLGELPLATHALHTSLAILRRSDNIHGLALVLQALGEVALAQNQIDDAARHYREALQYSLQTGEKRRAAFCLEGFAATLARAGQPERAVILLGAADALRQATGALLYAAERAPYEALVERLRADLPAQFAVAWRAGQHLELRAAIEFALA